MLSYRYLSLHSKLLFAFLLSTFTIEFSLYQTISVRAVFNSADLSMSPYILNLLTQFLALRVCATKIYLFVYSYRYISARYVKTLRLEYPGVIYGQIHTYIHHTNFHLLNNITPFNLFMC